MIKITTDQGSRYLLEDEETILTVLRDSRVPLRKIWGRPENADLKKVFKSPWWVGAGVEVFVPASDPGQETMSSGQHHRLRLWGQQTIDVYLGFMDEEVNARLERLIASQKDAGEQSRPVVLIERGQVEPDSPILEWRLANYEIGGENSPVRRILQVSPQTPIEIPGGPPASPSKRGIDKVEKPKGPEQRPLEVNGRTPHEHKAPEDILAEALAVFMKWDLASDLDWLERGLAVKRYFDVIKILQHQIKYFVNPKLRAKPKLAVPDKPYRPEDHAPPRRELTELEREKAEKKETEAKGPWISVVRFEVGRNENAPIIVIRSPEMGLQPSLMTPYFAFLFKVISVLSSQLAAESNRDPQTKKVKPGTWEWPIRVSEFGAQGSSSGLFTPGADVTVMASLFVGKESASDVTVEASEAGGKITATYKHSDDSTEHAPGWDVTLRRVNKTPAKKKDERLSEWAEGAGYRSSDERTTEGELRYPHGKPPKEIPPQKYHRYGGFKTRSTSHGYAVVSLCTPAAVYDFFRIDIGDFCRLAADENGSYYSRFKWQLRREYDERKPASVETERVESTEDVSAGKLMQDVFNEHKEWHEWEVIERAEDLAAWAYRRHAAELRLRRVPVLDDANPYSSIEKQWFPGGEGEPTLPEVLEKVVGSYSGRFCKKNGLPGIVTLTVSYFGGDPDKKTAEELGIEGVNMEDYHVLRVLRSCLAKGVSQESDYPMIKDWRVDRVNCDPKEIPKKAIEDFNKYRTDLVAALAADDYVRVIIWGLRGVLRRDVEENNDQSRRLKEALRWEFLGWKRDGRHAIPLPQLRTLLWSCLFDESKKLSDETRSDFWVPDPFCIEIATDFVDELQKMDPGIHGFGKDDRRRLELMSRASAVMKAWRDHDRHSESFGLAYDDGKTATAVAALRLVKYLKDQEVFPSLDEKLAMWLRPGKWPGVDAATLQEPGAKFSGAAVDRAFYKSANMMMLQSRAHLYLWEGGEARH